MSDMNDSEQKQLDDIHSEVQGSHAQLGAINERTLNIQRSINQVSEEVNENKDDIDELQDKVKRNTTIVSAVSGGIGMIALWLSDKIMRLF
jgi:uncharacterized protein YoxC